MSDDTRISILMKTITCRCGVLYMIPHWTEGHQCPCCGYRRTELVRKDLDRAEGQIVHLSRCNNSLRGTIKRMRKRSQ